MKKLITCYREMGMGFTFKFPEMSSNSVNINRNIPFNHCVVASIQNKLRMCWCISAIHRFIEYSNLKFKNGVARIFQTDLKMSVSVMGPQNRWLNFCSSGICTWPSLVPGEHVSSSWHNSKYNLNYHANTLKKHLLKRFVIGWRAICWNLMMQQLNFLDHVTNYQK